MFHINILLSVVNIMFLFDIHQSEILYVTKSSNVTIRCPFKSVKNTLQWSGPPNLTLYSDNSVVKSALKDVGIIRGSENGDYNLIIYGFKESNEGTYRCQTLSGENIAMHAFNVMLQIRKPILSMSISPSEFVTEGTNVSFQCMAKSNPSPSLLKLNGPDGNVLKFNNISDEEMRLRFTISDIRSNEIGNYTCTAENTISNGTASVWLNILYYPEVPSIIRILPGIKSVNIDWRGGSNGGSPQTFFIEYKQESQEKWFDHINITDTHETSYTAVINNLLPNELYDVRMYAVNSMNRSQFTNVFNVTTGDDSSSNIFSYSPVYITVGLGLFFTTMASVGYLWYKSDNLKRRHEHSENRNSGQQEGNAAFNNIYGINENRQPTVPGAASASVVYSNFSRNEHNESLRTDRLRCRPSTSHIKPLDQQLVKQKPSELNYIEIDLDPIPQDRTFYIHGKDNRTEYSEIDIGVSDPLQFSESETDDDNDTIDCEAINA